MTGCATSTKVEYIKPECQVPPPPVLQDIQWSEFACLSDDTKDKYEDNQAALVDSLIEHRSILKAICEQ